MSPACVLLPLLLGAATAAPPALRPSKEELTRCLAQVVSDMLTLGQAQRGPCMALLHREMCAPELRGCGAADASLEKREAGETRSGQEDEAARVHENRREQAVREQLHSRLHQEDVQEDVQEDGQKSGARGAFGGPWWLRLEGTGGTQKRVAEQARDEETEKDVKVLGDARGLWQGPEAEQLGEPSQPHHVHQPPAEAQQEEKEAAREKAEREAERLEHVREELKKATEVLGEELRREG
ncbi:coiled-coil domain-containing glutamate-rich protein 2 [Sorex araneus]|uniref:coiled-coil domain-containing glutamate-rich protein 2 n=1 Tax=Sorex araneus TaxID=42254 RepID=UPI0024337A4B|nr:coiled-coil domain-containing glutamate-rich protein 2 [Sorex araneus]